jgi:hypothetical protein
MSLRNIVAGLLAVITLSVSGLAAAETKSVCDAGDALVGPNCIHTVEDPDCACYSPDVTAYRVSNQKKQVVWTGEGRVTMSTSSVLKMSVVLRGSAGGPAGQVTRTYKWDGSAYVFASEAPRAD